MENALLVHVDVVVDTVPYGCVAIKCRSVSFGARVDDDGEDDSSNTLVWDSTQKGFYVRIAQVTYVNQQAKSIAQRLEPGR